MRLRQALEWLLHNWPAKVLSLTAAILLLVFHDISRLEERFFSVPLELELPRGYVPASDHPNNVRISLRGESEEIFRILEEDIRAYVDLSDHDTSGLFKVPVEVERRGTARAVEPLEISVEPLNVAITLEEGMQKGVDVVPSMSGFPPTGYELSRYRVSPSTVEIEGPSTHVEDIGEVSTEEIDLTGRREDFSVRVRLQRPDPLVSFLGGDVVEFRGIIEEAVVLHTFETVDIVLLGVDPELQIEGSLPTGLIRVQGQQPYLDNVAPEDVQLIADASSITEAGTHSIPVRPDVPQGLVVLRYEPRTVEIVLGER